MPPLEFLFTFLALIILCLIWLSLLIIPVWAIAFIYGTSAGAPFVPTNRKTVEKMLELADIKPGQVVYDLGCGDGRLVFAAAEKGARTFGVEINITVDWFALLLKKIFRKKGTLLRKNLFDLDLRDADVVFCYLLKHAMHKLDAKFKDELKKGCRIVSHNFPLPGWEMEQRFFSDTERVAPVIVYTVR